MFATGTGFHFSTTICLQNCIFTHAFYVIPHQVSPSYSYGDSPMGLEFVQRLNFTLSLIDPRGGNLGRAGVIPGHHKLVQITTR